MLNFASIRVFFMFESSDRASGGTRTLTNQYGRLENRLVHLETTNQQARKSFENFVQENAMLRQQIAHYEAKVSVDAEDLKLAEVLSGFNEVFLEPGESLGFEKNRGPSSSDMFMASLAGLL